jgi:hypothetical protein
VDDLKAIEVTPQMIEAGLSAWDEVSSGWGPPEVDGKEVVVEIYKAMRAAAPIHQDAD